MGFLDRLNEQAMASVAWMEKRPGVYQVLLPFYHEDGDMVEVFANASPEGGQKVRISDCGMTLQRLSYALSDPFTKSRVEVVSNSRAVSPTRASRRSTRKTSSGS